MKDQATRRLILREAYMLFLCNNFEKVTIPKIESATEKCRGTIFHHFKDKQTLFDSIVEEMFLPSFALPSELIESACSNLFETFLDDYMSPEMRVISLLKKEYGVRESEISYFHFVEQAEKYYPRFKECFRGILLKEQAILKTAIDNAKNRNEIKDIDTELLAALFQRITIGSSFLRGFTSAEVSSVSVNSMFYQIIKNR